MSAAEKWDDDEITFADRIAHQLNEFAGNFQ